MRHANSGIHRFYENTFKGCLILLNATRYASASSGNTKKYLYCMQHPIPTMVSVIQLCKIFALRISIEIYRLLSNGMDVRHALHLGRDDINSGIVDHF